MLLSSAASRMMRRLSVALACLVGASGVVVSVAGQTSYPTAVLTNGVMQATVYLPDPDRGYYRSTRFDWSGMVAGVEFGGHRFYDPWFTRSEPGVRDFVYRGNEIVAGAESSAVGLAEEFPQPQGFDSAQVGGTFVKVGVGLLRKMTDAAYSPFRAYDMVDPGTWSTEVSSDAVTSTQRLDAAAIGFGYEYRKTVRLVSSQPELVIEHELLNTGRRPIETTQYNHNFLTIDGTPTGAAFRITVPFDVRTPQPPDAALATIRGREIAYARTLVDNERVAFPVEGHGPDISDYDVLVENRATGASVQITSDRPMVRAYLWSIRSVISFEPFVDVTTKPGESTRWTYRYRYGGAPGR
jgi:hypothetical protein